ncbi:MAG: polysaccharide deacetylase family protein [Candidatus Spyradenecus sp.]
MNWGFASYETRFRWVAAIWAVILTGWCFADTNWKVRVVGALLWVIITVVLSLRFAWWRPRSEREVPIFLLLGRRSESGADETFLSLAGLEVLIRNLLAAGYRFQTVTEAIVAPARKSVAMTFDGGAREILGSLLPILQRYKVKATLFVTKAGEREANSLKPLEIQELVRSGLIEIGGTVEPLAADAPQEAWQAAIAHTRHWIAGVVGQLPRVFAYPQGVQPEQLEEAVRAAGYTEAMSVGRQLRPVKDAPFDIRRRLISGNCKPWQAYLLATRGRFSALSTPKM